MTHNIPKRKHEKLHNPIEQHFNQITRYHYVLFLFLFLSKIPIFWQVVSMLFLTPPMNYKCLQPPGNNICPCYKYEWDTSVFTKTLQTKYDLICDRKYLIGICHSTLYFGSVLGSFAYGMISDIFGRLATFCVCILFLALFGSLVSMINSLPVYLFLRLLQGLSLGGATVTGYVLCVEYCGVKQRELVAALFYIPLNIAHASLAGVSYITRDVDDFQRLISLPLILFSLIRFFVSESPKWLMDNGQIDKAAAAMARIAKFNNTSYGPIRAEMLAFQEMHATQPQEKAHFWHIFQHRHLIVNFTCLTVIYFSCGIGYYGVTQYIGQMNGDIHLNVAISGLMILPGTISTVFLLRTLYRKTFLSITTFTSGTLMLIVIFIPEHHTTLRLLLACLGNSFFFMSLIIVFLYGVELFPTPVRNSVLGILAIFARLGQMAAPIVNQLPHDESGLIYGTFAICAGILCIPLPETKNKDLPANLEDAEYIDEELQEPNKIRSTTTTYPTMEHFATPGVNIRH